MKPITEKHTSESIALELRRWFDYDQENGGFIWRARPAHSKAQIGSRAGRGDTMGYQMIRVFGQSYKTHRLVWVWHKGAWPAAQLDHINMDKMDNRIENLREAEAWQNNAYRSSPVRDLPRGVIRKKRGKLRAVIASRGKTIELGGFDTVEQAQAAYKAASLELHGEFSIIARPD